MSETTHADDYVVDEILKALQPTCEECGSTDMLVTSSMAAKVFHALDDRPELVREIKKLKRKLWVAIQALKEG